MEVPVISRIQDVHMGLTSLQNPYISSGVQSVSFAYTFCKWSAVILALVATFGGLIHKVNVLIVTFRRHSPPLPSISIPLLNGDDYSSSDEEEEEVSSSRSSLSSEFEEEEEEEDETAPSSSSLMSSFNWRMPGDEDFRVRVSSHRIDDQLQSDSVKLRRRRSITDIFSLSEIVNSKSVVKLWDSIGFGLGLDFDEGEIYAGSLTRPEAAAASSSPSAVVLSAEKNASGKTAVKIWDSRLRRRLPTVIAEWRPNLGKIVGVGFGEVEKFYVRDDEHDDVTVGDLRNVSSPLQNVTESDADTCWDTDAVIVSAEN